MPVPYVPHHRPLRASGSCSCRLWASRWLLLTFILVIPPILRDAEELIVKGIAWTTFLHVLVLLLPQALSLTIPMSVLLGILIGFGRLSADREFVAMQACGVSPFRLIRPVAVLCRAGHPGHGPPDHCRTARGESDLPRDYLQRRREPRGKQRQAARVLTESSPTGPSTRGTSSPAAGARCFSPTPPSRARRRSIFAKEGRLRVDREKRTGRVGADRRDVAHDVGHQARRVRGRRLRQHDHPPRSGHGVPQHRAGEDGDAR